MERYQLDALFSGVGMQAATQQEAMAEAEASVATLQIAMGSETAKVLAEMGQQKQLQEDAEDRLAAEIETVQLLEVGVTAVVTEQLTCFDCRRTN